MNSKKFNNSGLIGDSPNPTLLQARLTLEDDDSNLTLYDNALGVEEGNEIAYLDKTNPTVDFREEGYFCHKGLYAHLPQGGSYFIIWKD